MDPRFLNDWFVWDVFFGPKLSLTHTCKAPQSAIAATNVSVSDAECVLLIDVPGVKKEDVSLKITGRTLCVEAKRGDMSTKREWLLDTACVTDDATASLDSGVLTVKIPRQKHTSRDVKID